MASESLQVELDGLLSSGAEFKLFHSSTPFPVLTNRTHITVLDSSFNPPTLAHLALCSPQSNACAHLLLLSTSNADKSFPSSQLLPRLEMMERLLLSPSAPRIPTGIACISTPFFIDKSRILHSHFGKSRIRFIIGWDTLIRFFNPLYYGGMEEMKRKLITFFAPDQDGSSLICFRRALVPIKEEESFLAKEGVKEFVQMGDGVAIVDFTGDGKDELMEISSSLARGLKGEKRKEELERLCGEEVADYIVRTGLYL